LPTERERVHGHAVLDVRRILAAYFANVSYFLKQVPPAQAGHALGLFLREGRRFSSSKAERGAVVELGTKSTTRVPHRPSRRAAGRSRSQPVRSATKCLL